MENWKGLCNLVVCTGRGHLGPLDDQPLLGGTEQNRTRGGAGRGKGGNAGIVSYPMSRKQPAKKGKAMLGRSEAGQLLGWPGKTSPKLESGECAGVAGTLP